MKIEYSKVDTVDTTDFIDMLHRSGVAERRPVNDEARMARMLQTSTLIIVALILTHGWPGSFVEMGRSFLC